MNICRTSKDVFDKYINMPNLEEEKHDQSEKENIPANDLGIFKEINKEKMYKEELGASHIQPIG